MPGGRMRLLSFHKELPNIVLVREHPPAPLCKGSWQKSLIFD